MTSDRILVAGEALVDLRPGPGGYQPCPGGGPYNTAVALGRLGVPAAWLGRLSTDPFGRLLEQGLAAAGVDLAAARHGEAPTPLAVVTLGEAGAENEYAFYLTGTVAPELDAHDLPPLDGLAAVHVGTVALTLEPVATALELLVTRAAGRQVVGLDPNVRPGLVGDRERYVARLDRLAALADLVKLSDADARWLAPGEPPEVLAERWLGAGAGIVVVTRGGEGATAHTAAGTVLVEAVPVDVVDTVGAGDAFNAGLLAWLHDHDRLTPRGVRGLAPHDVASAVRFAALVAAKTCTRAGADPPWRRELPADTPTEDDR